MKEKIIEILRTSSLIPQAFPDIADKILNVLSESACPKCGQVNCPQHGYHYIEEQE